VLQLSRDARLVDEHLDELGIGREVRQDALDREQLRDAVAFHALGEPHLGHAADGHALEQEVLAERDELGRRRGGARAFGLGGLRIHA
jgi:hypothetical protein